MIFIENKKVNELKQYCRKNHIKGFYNKNKSELIKLIKQYENNQESKENENNQESKENENNQESKENKEKDREENMEENKEEDIEGNKINFIDLFAGTGAFSLVLEKNNKFNCVFTNDFNKSSKKIYELNFPSNKFTLQDLNDIDINNIPEHNLLCGGFPCQPFSIAGNQKGFEDKRSNVFWKIIEILKKYTPEIIILENVKNLKSHDKGNTYKIIVKQLEDIGYNLKSKILDTCKITNIPQHRERIYIVGFKNKEKYDKFNFDFKEKENNKIVNILDKNINDKYYYDNRFKVFDKIKDGINKNISEDVIYQYRRYFIRENKSGKCPTLTANMGSGGHNVPLLMDNKGIRKLTPRECFNLQGFPDHYKLPNISDGTLYKLAGNAVSVPVVELIVNKLNAII